MGRWVDAEGTPFNDYDYNPTDTLPSEARGAPANSFNPNANTPNLSKEVNRILSQTSTKISKENKMTIIYLDHEIRQHLVDYFTKSINHSYSDAKYVRMLLKAQNLTINDILIPSEPEEIAHTPTHPEPACQAGTDANGSNDPIFDTYYGDDFDIPKTTTIKPIPSNKDIDDLEYCYNHLEFLTQSRQKFILDNFKSRKDNTVVNSNNDTLSPARRRYVDICLGIIVKETAK